MFNKLRVKKISEIDGDLCLLYSVALDRKWECTSLLER